MRRTALLLDLDDRRREAAHMRPPSPLRTAPCVRIAACAILVFAGCAAVEDVPRRPPNVVVILVDDMGWRDVGPYGQRFAETPRIDALARQGTTFDAAYAACPVCSPTRAALLTGKYPPRVDITDWIPGNADRDKPLVPPQDRDDLAPEETTLAEALRAQGYSTFHVGKWHLGGAGRLPEDQGFDVNVMGGHIGHPASYFFPYGAATATRPAHSHAVPALPPGGAPGDYLTARQAAEAVRLIAGVATADKPFLLYLPFYSVHAPLEAPAATVEKYRRKKATAEGAAAAGAMRPVHAAMVEETDRAVGRVLDALDAAGVAENTLVVFTSDNGGAGGATDLAPLRGSKRTLYEGGVRVPLVVRYPGVARAGARTNVVAITQDLFATVCAAAGAETSPEVRTDARDLTPALRGDGDLAERDAVFWHFPHYLNDGGPPSGAVRSGRWKLIEPYGGGPAQLFDLSADPGESHDLAAERPEVADDLRARHAAWRASVGARMPTRRGG